MKENKICFIISDVNESHQFNALFDGLKTTGYEVSLLFIGTKYPKIAEIFAEKNFTVEFIKCVGKKDFPQTFYKIYSLLGRIKPDIVHTHLQTASLIGLAAAKLRGIKKRVHTRHHSAELHEYHPHAVYYDKFCNALSKRIIATSRNVERTLIEKENVDPSQISIVHHGFQLADFKTDPVVVAKLKDKYDTANHFPVVGVISRFVEGKGIQYIIPAFAETLKNFPKAKLVLANAKGDYSAEIHGLLSKYLPPENYVLIDFESRIFELYKTFDVFIHAPVSLEYEAFGQTYIEALALKIPSIFTLSGIAADFIADKKNALVVDFRNSAMIVAALENIIESKELREKLQEQGKADVENLFSIDKMIDSLSRTYSAL